MLEQELTSILKDAEKEIDSASSMQDLLLLKSKYTGKKRAEVMKAKISELNNINGMLAIADK